MIKDLLFRYLRFCEMEGITSRQKKKIICGAHMADYFKHIKDLTRHLIKIEVDFFQKVADEKWILVYNDKKKVFKSTKEKIGW